LRAGRAGEIGYANFPFGQYSDDSQLARELLLSYVSCGRFAPEDYAQRIAAIFREERVVEPGLATIGAASRLNSGVPWQEAGTPPPAAGNGSAMRAGPIGLLFFDDPRNLIRAAYDQGRITHRDKRSLAGAVAIAGAVALALRPGPIYTTSFINELINWVQTIDTSMTHGLEHLQKWTALQPEEAVTLIASFEKGPLVETWERISPFVIGSVLWSLYAFLRSSDDYWETICTAIGAGGDTDTMAAMAGAVCGAHLGIKALPLGLASHLTDNGQWGLAELIDLASNVYRIKMAP
jgi:ADP-ribosylglycohydrolase